jgi:hypothetical protein
VRRKIIITGIIAQCILMSLLLCGCAQIFAGGLILSSMVNSYECDLTRDAFAYPTIEHQSVIVDYLSQGGAFDMEILEFSKCTSPEIQQQYGKYAALYRWSVYTGKGKELVFFDVKQKYNLDSYFGKLHFSLAKKLNFTNTHFSSYEAYNVQKKPKDAIDIYNNYYTNSGSEYRVLVLNRKFRVTSIKPNIY